ncbi:MAG TPA: transporter substrate-binding domain-containing protein [Jiangellaceae bacterium]
MHTRRLGGLLLVLTAGLSGCTPESDPNLLDVGATDFAPHSTPAQLAAAGNVTIGITGNDLDEDDVPVSFEAELGKMIAGALGIAPHEISWVQTDALNHERLIEDGHVDLVIAAMPITDRSLEIVDFAGPYHVGGVAVLSGSAEPETERICATAEIGDLVPDVAIVGTAQDCVAVLTDGTVDAVLAPDLVLAAEVTSHLRIGDTESEPLAYGIGLRKGDDDLRSFVTDVLATVADDGRWQAAWASTLEPVLGAAEPPPLESD